MDYTITLEGFKGFRDALTRFSEHEVGAWSILHPFVKVRRSCELLMVVNMTPCSLSVNYQACYIDGLQGYSGGC